MIELIASTEDAPHILFRTGNALRALCLAENLGWEKTIGLPVGSPETAACHIARNYSELQEEFLEDALLVPAIMDGALIGYTIVPFRRIEDGEIH